LNASGGANVARPAFAQVSPSTRVQGSSVSGWGTPILTPLMKDIDHGRTAPIQTG
jgi:hypothetical protein